MELYDLRRDPHEDEDLVAREPERAEALLAKLDRWRKSVRAQMPSRNPDHDPSRPTVIRFNGRDRPPRPYRVD
jgi:hypothetical protein